jgi:phosphatidylglycerophosphatase A
VTSDRILKFIATIGPAGYFPTAPGTFAAAIAMALYILIRPDGSILILLIPPLFFVGTIASSTAEAHFNQTDPGKIVIDEFVGYLVSLIYIPFSIPNAIMAFLFFRIFDIIKPFPIRHLEKKLPGGLSVMFDDILAGIYANILLRLTIAIWNRIP